MLILTGDVGQDLLQQFNTSVNNLATDPSLLELKSNLTQVYKKLALVTHPDKLTPTELQEKLEEIETKTPWDTIIKAKLLSNNENQGALFKFMSSTL